MNGKTRNIHEHVESVIEASIRHRPRIYYPLGLQEGNDEGRHKVVLPLPPSVNHAFPTFNGRRVKSGAYKEWLNEAGYYALAQDFPQREKQPAKKLWTLDTAFFFPDWRSDMDNRYKVLIDWLCGRLGLSDNYLVEQYSCRFNVAGVEGVLALVAEW